VVTIFISSIAIQTWKILNEHIDEYFDLLIKLLIGSKKQLERDGSKPASKDHVTTVESTISQNHQHN